MANRTPRKSISGLFPSSSIEITDHPDLPGGNLYRLHLGPCDTLIPDDDARAEFSRLVSLIHAQQEASDHGWLEDKVGHLTFPRDPRRRREVFAGVTAWLDKFPSLPAPTLYDLKLRDIFKIAIEWLRRPDGQIPADQIHGRLERIYGPAFSDRFSKAMVRRAYTARRAWEDSLLAGRRRLRRLTPHTAQQSQ